MHPAPSVIVFTVLSGLGFGLLTWLGLGIINPTGMIAFTFFFIAYALAVGGLLASTLHLGNPQRFLKAFSQWKTSWLSREAWLSVAALMVMGFYALGAIFFDTHIRFLGVIGAALSVATVGATSMIYAQLRAVPRWNHWTTVVLFLAFSLGGGALLAGQLMLAGVLMLVLGAAMVASWILGDTQFSDRASTIETATGLGKIGKVRLFEAPHTGTNYLMREMIHVVARKHVTKLRVISLTCASILPAVILLAMPAGHVSGLIAVALHLLGAFAARWLFFAQAEHVVGLYYGERG
jgi:sulfite dehydrogenase (quinone) subunit SoeC